jgi:hypothetical protein
MFQQRNDAIPPQWLSQPEMMRMVLSMAANIDLGYLRAMQLHSEDQGGNPGIERRLNETAAFLSALQERA